MRNFLVFSTTLVLTLFFISCSTAKIPGKGALAGKAKSTAKAELTEGTVEVLESAMEKTEGYDFSEDKGIIITGTAKYIPAKVNPEPFEDFNGDFRFILLDQNGNQVRTFYVSSIAAECGVNGKKENVKPNEAFPFKLEKKDIDPDDWEKTVDHEFKEWH